MTVTVPAPHPPTSNPGTELARKALYRVPEAMQLLSLSRSVLYHQIRTGACAASRKATPG